MVVVPLIAIAITMALALTRAGLGPTIWDRIAAVNMFGTKTVLLIAMLAFLNRRADFLDLALVYALINFVGVFAVLRYTKYGHFADPEEDEETG